MTLWAKVYLTSGSETTCGWKQSRTKKENKNSNKWETVLSLEMPIILYFYHECLFTQYIPSRNLNFNITNTLNFDYELLTLVFEKMFLKQLLLRRFPSVLVVQDLSLERSFFKGEKELHKSKP